MNTLCSLFSRLVASNDQTDSGLTLIECLVAIAVIALTSATIAPVMVLSVATRVQNQKSEQALQIAQGEVDRIRLLIERNPTYSSADLALAESASAPLSSTPSTTPGTAITTVGKPTALSAESVWTASGYTPSAVTAREIDVNGDSNPDFVLQSFRGGAVEVAVTPTVTMPVAFDMGVRVYDYAAVTDDAGDIISDLDTDAATLGFTSGEGQRGRKPLAVLYTQIINSDNPQSLCRYMDYLRASAPGTMDCS
ncbi:MAG: prepilin-type N-terminal cleavage/methylation domain-containing protein [Cyanobacteria bacterium P01_D01_bin.1]